MKKIISQMTLTIFLCGSRERERERETVLEKFDSSDHIANEEGHFTLINVSYVDDDLFVWEVLPFTYASLFHLLTPLMTQSVVMNNRSTYYNGESKSS